MMTVVILWNLHQKPRQRNRDLPKHTWNGVRSIVWHAAVCLAIRISPRTLSRHFHCSKRRRKKATHWPCATWAGCWRMGWARRLIYRLPMCGTERRWLRSMLWRNRRKTAMRSTGSANSMPRASAVSRTMVMPPGGSNFPQTKGTSMRNIPLPACFAVDRVWSRTMRGRWSYTQPPHSRTSPMLPTS